jgi:hypothetical protein
MASAWIRVLQTTPGALADFSAYMQRWLDTEDRLSKANTVEELHYQRGKIDAIRSILFAVKHEK